MGKKLNKSWKQQIPESHSEEEENMDMSVIMRYGDDKAEELCLEVEDYWARVDESDVCNSFIFLIVNLEDFYLWGCSRWRLLLHVA